MIARKAAEQPLFKTLFALSLGVAAFAVWRMMSSGNGYLNQWFEIAFLWLGVFAAGAVLYGRRALLFLVSAPIALGPAALVTVYMTMCATQRCS